MAEQERKDATQEFIRNFTNQSEKLRELSNAMEAMVGFEKARIKRIHELFFIVTLIILAVGFSLGIMFLYSHQQLAGETDSLVNVSSEVASSLKQLSLFMTSELKENREQLARVQDKNSVLEIEIKQLKHEKVELEDRLVVVEEDILKLREDFTYLEKYVMENLDATTGEELTGRIGRLERQLQNLRRQNEELQRAVQQATQPAQPAPPPEESP